MVSHTSEHFIKVEAGEEEAAAGIVMSWGKDYLQFHRWNIRFLCCCFCARWNAYQEIIVLAEERVVFIQGALQLEGNKAKQEAKKRKGAVFLFLKKHILRKHFPSAHHVMLFLPLPSGRFCPEVYNAISTSFKLNVSNGPSHPFVIHYIASRSSLFRNKLIKPFKCTSEISFNLKLSLNRASIQLVVFRGRSKFSQNPMRSHWNRRWSLEMTWSGATRGIGSQSQIFPLRFTNCPARGKRGSWSKRRSFHWMWDLQEANYTVMDSVWNRLLNLFFTLSAHSADILALPQADWMALSTQSMSWKARLNRY